MPALCPAPTPYALRLGDCLDILPTLAENSIDAIITDPPYGLGKPPDMVKVMDCWLAGKPYTESKAGFMGRTWDAFVPGPEVWRQALRVLKPGGHLLAFFGSRTYDIGTLAIRLAGFQVRDQIMWIYASGMPKSHATLKPAHEPICVARKPFSGSARANAEKYGTGRLNIEACRVPLDVDDEAPATNPNDSHTATTHLQGRWPSNLVHDGSDDVLNAFPAAPGQIAKDSASGQSSKNQNTCGQLAQGSNGASPREDTSQSAARFFYCAKTSRVDRHEGLSDPGPQFRHGTTLRKVENTATTGNDHPTVKPTSLMQWLCRLACPPGGTILDPYMGSGSTGKAAILDGFSFIGIDNDPHCVEIAAKRIDFAHRQVLRQESETRQAAEEVIARAAGASRPHETHE